MLKQANTRNWMPKYLPPPRDFQMKTLFDRKFLSEKLIGGTELENCFDLKCLCLRGRFSSDTCQEESSEWRAQENARLFIGKSRAVKTSGEIVPVLIDMQIKSFFVLSVIRRSV